ALYPWFGGADGGSAEMANYFSGTNLPSSMHMRDLIHRATGIDLLNNPWYHNSVYYTIYSHPPNHNRSLFGDHGGGPKSGPPGSNRYVTTRYRAALFNDPFAAAYAREYEGNPLLRVSLREAYDWLAKPVPEPKSLSLLPDARVFTDIGVVHMHTAMERPNDNIFFEFKSGPYGSFGHSHNDQNTFNLMAFNEPLLIDTGYYHSYGDAHHAGWTMRTKAHNGILVDNTGQPNSDLSAFGRVIDFKQGDDYMYCAGEAHWAYNEVDLDRFTRHTLCIKPDLFVIYDQLRAPDAHTYEFLLHAEDRMGIDHLTQTVDVTGEMGKCRATILQPNDLRISQNDEFDPPAKHWRPDKSWPMPNQWHLTAETTEPSSEACFLTVLEVRRNREAFAQDVHVIEGDDWIGLRIDRGTSEVVAAFARELPPLDGPQPAVDIQLPGLEARAFAAAAETANGEAVRVVTIAGDRAAVR
ncbi:MAG: heparinase II/III family protein, partial [Armatimonadota bacterium]